MIRIAVYPGSFDPITNGHIDIIKRALKICDKLIIALGVNTTKDYLFSVDERIDIANQTLKEILTAEQLKKITVESFPNLLIDYAKEKNASMIIRGVRALSDFDFEFNLAGVNHKLNPDIETIFLITTETNQFISSRFVKEIVTFGGDISKFVPQYVSNIIKKRNQ